MNIDTGTIEFLEKLNEDSSLQSELEAALAGADDKTGAVIALAASKGIEVNRGGFDTARAALIGATADSGAMNETELASVAGGFNPQPEPPARVSRIATGIRFDARTLLGWSR